MKKSIQQRWTPSYTIEEVVRNSALDSAMNLPDLPVEPDYFSNIDLMNMINSADFQPFMDIISQPFQSSSALADELELLRTPDGTIENNIQPICESPMEFNHIDQFDIAKNIIHPIPLESRSPPLPLSQSPLAYALPDSPIPHQPAPSSPLPLQPAVTSPPLPSSSSLNCKISEHSQSMFRNITDEKKKKKNKLSLKYRTKNPIPTFTIPSSPIIINSSSPFSPKITIPNHVPSSWDREDFYPTKSIPIPTNPITYPHFTLISQPDETEEIIAEANIMADEADGNISQNLFKSLDRSIEEYGQAIQSSSPAHSLHRQPSPLPQQPSPPPQQPSTPLQQPSSPPQHRSSPPASPQLDGQPQEPRLPYERHIIKQNLAARARLLDNVFMALQTLSQYVKQEKVEIMNLYHQL